MPLSRRTVFVSYCHCNKRWLQRLRVHLTPLERQGVLDIWDDTRIHTGDRWHDEIDQAIERAAASILLISADFLASDFINVHELPKLLRRAERAGARILPIIVEPCELSVHPVLSSFQALNSPRQPLATMSRAEAEQIWVRAATTVGKLFESPMSRAETPPAKRKASEPVSELFEELQAASVACAVLWLLSSSAQELSLSELEKRLDLRSRKTAFEALERLAAEQWVEKVRRDQVRYRITDEGVRQLRRLAAASDGPVRRLATSG